MNIQIQVMDKQQIIDLSSSENLKNHAKSFSDGYFVIKRLGTSDPQIIDGPYLDEQYAIHWAVNMHGMDPPDGYNPKASCDGML